MQNNGPPKRTFPCSTQRRCVHGRWVREMQHYTSLKMEKRATSQISVYLPAFWLECKLPKGQKLVLFTIVFLAPSTVPAI